MKLLRKEEVSPILISAVTDMIEKYFDMYPVIIHVDNQNKNVVLFGHRE
jgi:hypothetical protein